MCVHHTHGNQAQPNNKPTADGIAWGQAVANAVLFELAWHPDSKAELHREAWLADTSFHPLRNIIASLESPTAWSDMCEAKREMVHLDFQDHYLDRAYEAQSAASTVYDFNYGRSTGDEASC